MGQVMGKGKPCVASFGPFATLFSDDKRTYGTQQSRQWASSAPKMRREWVSARYRCQDGLGFVRTSHHTFLVPPCLGTFYAAVCITNLHVGPQLSVKYLVVDAATVHHVIKIDSVHPDTVHVHGREEAGLAPFFDVQRTAVDRLRDRHVCVYVCVWQAASAQN